MAKIGQGKGWRGSIFCWPLNRLLRARAMTERAGVGRGAGCEGAACAAGDGHRLALVSTAFARARSDAAQPLPSLWGGKGQAVPSSLRVPS
eukprot:911267-Pyramimonas_sp.AAC.1